LETAVNKGFYSFVGRQRRAANLFIVDPDRFPIDRNAIRGFTACRL